MICPLCNGSAKQCIQCKWERMGPTWLKRFPWLAENKSGSKPAKLLCLTCEACARAGSQPPRFSSYASVQVSHFLDHERTLKHRAAMSDPDLVATLAAPPEADFLDCLKKIRLRKACGDDGSGDVKRKKLRKIKFCLAEAVRITTRCHLRTAESMTVHSDASQGVLLIRGQMCGQDLCPHHVLLGAVHMEDKASGVMRNSALDIAGLVAGALRDLATPLKTLRSVIGGCAPQPAIDVGLLQHACDIVEVFNADAARDEQLAGTILQHGVDGWGDAPEDTRIAAVFKNMIVLNKDKPHGARRTTRLFNLR